MLARLQSALFKTKENSVPLLELEKKEPVDEEKNLFFKRQTSVAMILPYLDGKPLVNLSLTNKICHEVLEHESRKEPKINLFRMLFGMKNLARQQNNIQWLDSIAEYVEDSRLDKCCAVQQ